MSPVNHDLGLRKRVILPLVTFGILILTLGSYLIFRIEKVHLTRTVEYQSYSMREHFQTMLISKSKNMATDLWFIAQNPEIVRAVRTRDRKALLQLSSKLYEYLHTEEDITHLYFDDAQRINLVRVHQPQRYGDKINRYTTLQAERDKSLSTGLELGPLGTLTLRAVLPVIEDNVLYGFIELGQEIDELIRHAKNIFGFEIFVLINKTFLERSAWESGMKMLDRHSNWDQLSTFVIVSQSLPRVPDSFLEKIASLSNEIRTPIQKDFDFNNRHYFTSLVPIQDVKGREVARLIMLLNTSEINAELSNVMLIGITCSIAMGFGIIYFFYRLLGRTETELSNARQQIIDDGYAKQQMQIMFIEELQTEHERLARRHKMPL